MISRLLKRKPYRGGPLFDQVSAHCFDLEGTSLELETPASTWVMKEAPRGLNYPFLSSGWFEANCDRRNIHDYISVFCEIWPYCPRGLERIVNLLAMGANDEFASMRFAVHLNRTEKGRKIDLADPQSLGAYLKWEYEDYFESPEQGPYAKGHNYKLRQECDETCNKPHRINDPFWEKWRVRTLEGLYPIPNDLTLVNFGGAQWTHFVLRKRANASGCNWSDYYCLALSESFYLEIELGCRFENAVRKLRPIIEADMKRTADWLLQHIKVTRPGSVSDRLPSTKSTA